MMDSQTPDEMNIFSFPFARAVELKNQKDSESSCNGKGTFESRAPAMDSAQASGFSMKMTGSVHHYTRITFIEQGFG
ncbi:hypothetical protein BWQ96_04328 [Gracilariopsis chorda]|uniref:Uncharacterized protein n=1 Tax=Gracilariopsis chorda TaxID=448386 RepID=A0A2V3IUU7_9FLOR|nr:hypothetical protein BWQ96_04328 [Gracilariopsis chorda]|eukprot:PXF45893.1 hypothetical protein BWQ96_04328 [Gracilariopsis chorda]